MAKPSHIPRFGNWDPNDHTPYTVVFDKARTDKGGKMMNPNDPLENEALFGKSSNVGSVNPNALASRPAVQHQRRASREDLEFGSSNQGYSSRGKENSFENGIGASVGSKVSPMHPQAYGRFGRKPGSASPAIEKKWDAGAIGMPNRNTPERLGSPIPKFGDWDVNNPSSAEGYTVIFDKARDEKKTGGAFHIQNSPLRPEQAGFEAQAVNQESSHWFCRCFHPSTV